jgi:hypothetical protein
MTERQRLCSLETMSKEQTSLGCSQMVSLTSSNCEGNQGWGNET